MGAPKPVLTLRSSVNATAFFQRTGPRPTTDESADWFVRPQADPGTPIFDQLAATHTGAIEFMHSKIQVELYWPAPPTSPDESTQAVGDATGINSEESND
jgi:hypothetical protein